MKDVTGFVVSGGGWSGQRLVDQIMDGRFKLIECTKFQPSFISKEFKHISWLNDTVNSLKLVREFLDAKGEPYQVLYDNYGDEGESGYAILHNMDLF